MKSEISQRMRTKIDRSAITARMRSPSFEKMLARWIDAQIIDGLSWQEAAKSVNLTQKRARVLFGHPRILSEMAKRAGMVRAGESVRNPAALAKIRDRGIGEGASAADAKASIEAMKLLENAERSSTINIHGSNNSVIAGYVVKIDGPAARPRMGGTPLVPIDVTPRVEIHDAD
jgi:hypothetical protein